MVDWMGTPDGGGLKQSNKLTERGKKRSPSQSPESTNTQNKHSKHHHVASGVPQTTAQTGRVVAGPDSPSDPQLRRNCNLEELNTPRTSTHETNGSLAWRNEGGLGEQLSALVTDTLLQFNEQCALSSAYSVSMSHAEAQLKRTTREYDSNKHHFSVYPAIEEQKGRAKKKAAESLESLKRLVNDQLARQKAISERVPESIMNMIKKSQQEAHSRTDQMSRDRIDELEQQLKTLKENNLKTQNDIEARFKSMEADQCKASAEKTRCSIETSSVKSRMDTMEKEINRQMKEVKEGNFKTVVEVSELRDSVSKVQEDVANVDCVTTHEFNNFQHLINDNVQKIQADTAPKPQPFHPSVDTLISRVDDLQGRVDRIQTASNSCEEQVNQILLHSHGFTGDVNGKMGALHQNITDLRQSIVEKVEPLDKAKALERVEALEKRLVDFDNKIIDVIAKQPQVVEYEPPRFVPLSPLGSSVTNGLVGTDQNSSGPQATRVLQDPRSVQTGNGSAPQPAHTAYDPVKVIALQNIVQHHQLVLDNLTTDNLHQGFVQHMSNTYPSAKNYESFAKKVETSLSNLQTKLQSQSDLIASCEAKSDKYGGEVENIKTNYNTTIGPDLMEMRKEIRTLQERVAKLEGNMRALKFTGR